MIWAIVAIGFFLVLLVKFPRFTISAVMLVGAGIGLLIVSGNQESDRRRNEEALVTAWADPVIPSAGCKPDYPITVHFGNGTKRTVNAISWELGIRRRGHSTNLVRFPSLTAKMDRILKPGESVSMCYSMPELEAKYEPEELEASAQMRYPEFAN